MNHNLTQAFSVLGLEPDATEKEIRRAYARLAKATRPDTDPEGFTRIRDAYEQALNHVKSAFQSNQHNDPTFSSTPSQKSNVGVASSNSGLDTILNTAPSFDDQHAGKQNRFESLSVPSYDEASDDFTDELYEKVQDTNLSDKAIVNENSDTFTQSSSDKKLVGRTAVEDAPPEPTNESINEPIAETAAELSSEPPVESTESLTSTQTEEDEFESKTIYRIQQLLDTSYHLLNEQEAYNAAIDNELIAIAKEIDALSSELKIGTRDDALERLARQIIEHQSAPFGFVEKVAEYLELVDSVLPNSAHFRMFRLQERYHSMREIDDFEKRSHGKDNFIAYFIHGEPKPFRFSGFPTKKDKKLYKIYSDMLLTAWPPRPDLIHPNAQSIIDQAEPVDEDDALKQPDPPFDKEQARYFFKVIWWIGWIGFGLYTFFGIVTPSTQDKMKNEIMDSIMNPSDDVKERIEAIKQQRQLESGN